jgi:hypothetical protein
MEWNVSAHATQALTSHPSLLFMLHRAVAVTSAVVASAATVATAGFVVMTIVPTALVTKLLSYARNPLWLHFVCVSSSLQKSCDCSFVPGRQSCAECDLEK